MIKIKGLSSKKITLRHPKKGKKKKRKDVLFTNIIKSRFYSSGHISNCLKPRRALPVHGPDRHSFYAEQL
jgi:hypothetical protein